MRNNDTGRRGRLLTKSLALALLTSTMPLTTGCDVGMIGSILMSLGQMFSGIATATAGPEADLFPEDPLLLPEQTQQTQQTQQTEEPEKETDPNRTQDEPVKTGPMGGATDGDEKTTPPETKTARNQEEKAAGDGTRVEPVQAEPKTAGKLEEGSSTRTSGLPGEPRRS